MIGYLYFGIGLSMTLTFIVAYFYDYYTVRRPLNKGSWIPDFQTWCLSFWTLLLIIAWPCFIASYIIVWYEKHSKK